MWVIVPKSECPALAIQRALFLANVDTDFASRLALAPHGDWPTVFLSPHLDLERLRSVVSFCGQIVDLLSKSQ